MKEEQSFNEKFIFEDHCFGYRFRVEKYPFIDIFKMK
jgi:hypothetical protein